ncbi:MAG: GntR family transcriptional regulator [Caulobacteraceae bacterium]|nr:GntR family transcriptional regulator [Caulobacteraceae bacterium]
MKSKPSSKAPPPAAAKRKSRTAGAASRSLAEAAYEAIWRDILTLTLHPGQKMSEAMLSDRFGFGKAPIRAALARLVQEGLVENHLRGGHMVAPITLADIQGLYHLRRMTLGEAVRMACGAVTDELRRAYERVANLEFAGATSDVILAFCFNNRDFTVALGRAAGNPLLATWITSLEDRFLRLLFLGVRSNPSADLYQADYRRIWSALEAGRAEDARKAMLEALAVSEKIITDAVLGMPELRTLNLGDLLGPAAGERGKTPAKP